LKSLTTLIVKKVFFKTLFAFLTFFFSSLSLRAQGSLYSVFGLGDLAYLPSSQSGGMGYVGVAVPSSLYINRVNPAMISSINTTRIVGDLSYTGFSATGNLGSTYQAFTGFNGAGFAVPIWKSVFATGIYPYSRLDYNQRQIGRLELPETDTVSLEYRYRGIGGLSTVPLALAFTPYNNRFRGTVRLGVSVNIMFGTVERTRETFLGSALTPQLTNRVEERASGTTFTFGGSYTKPRLFSRTDLLSFGASFTTGSSLNGERRDFLSGNGISDTLQSPTGTVTLPSTLALGISYLSEAYLLGLDVVLQNWSSFEYFGEDVSYTRNSFRLGIGGEKQPSRERLAKFFERIAYRAGAYYHQTPLRLAGTAIDEIGFTAGVGIPVSGEFSRFDINFEYAMRGTTAQSLIQENIFRVRFALNAGELWFQKRKIE
jgi:hypothetical protein